MRLTPGYSFGLVKHFPQYRKFCDYVHHFCDAFQGTTRNPGRFSFFIHGKRTGCFISRFSQKKGVS
ncbi:MAG: hypothetical protein H6Q26_1496 [Bacteroidetes bacterium]|nr:hypothetical protein [Bacteroidota bacterium]